MAFDPDQFIAETSTPPAGSGFDPDQFIKETEPKTLAGFGNNLASDATGTVKALFGPGGLGDGLMHHPIDTATSVIKGLPAGIINEGKRLGIGDLLTGHPIDAAEKFGDAAYNKPLTTALDVLPAVGAAGKALGFGGEAAETAGLGAKAAEVSPEAEEAASAAKAIPQAAQEAAEHIGNASTAASAQKAPGIIDELSDYIGPKVKQASGKLGSIYETQAKQPGWTNSVADYLQEKSQMMANQDLGATPLQARQVGHEGMRAIGQYALDNDIVSPTNGLRGMRAKNSELLNAAGKKLGDLRKEADAVRNPLSNPVDVLQEVRARLDPKYASALNADEAPEYTKALKAIEESDPTHQGFAKAATDLNAKANKAARLQQPHGPYTDVANTISEINNERIKALLGPEKAAQYETALRDFGVNKKIESFLARKAGGEVKRIGAGSFTSNMIQKGMDELGYKVGARALNKTSTAVLRNPATAKTLPSLFKQFIHDVELPEPNPGGGMAHGGIAGLTDFLSSKYGTQKEK